MNAKFNSPARALADLAEGSILAMIEIAAPPEARLSRAGQRGNLFLVGFKGDVPGHPLER